MLKCRKKALLCALVTAALLGLAWCAARAETVTVESAGNSYSPVVALDLRPRQWRHHQHVWGAASLLVTFSPEAIAQHCWAVIEVTADEVCPPVSDPTITCGQGIGLDIRHTATIFNAVLEYADASVAGVPGAFSGSHNFNIQFPVSGLRLRSAACLDGGISMTVQQ